MNTYISLLRGVNVGGRKILMNDLKTLYESLKFNSVKTYIQSGNVIFNSSNSSSIELEKIIEKEIKKVFDLQVPIIIRTQNDFKSIIDNNPFHDEDPKGIYITFLSDTVKNNYLKEIKLMKDGSEKIFMYGKEIYLLLPGGYGRTKLTNNLFEKKLRISATTRNWRTVNMLYELALNN